LLSGTKCCSLFRNVPSNSPKSPVPSRCGILCVDIWLVSDVWLRACETIVETEMVCCYVAIFWYLAFCTRENVRCHIAWVKMTEMCCCYVAISWYWAFCTRENVRCHIAWVKMKILCLMSECVHAKQSLRQKCVVATSQSWALRRNLERLLCACCCYF
jgi:hypothetical protein